ncbi:MAG: hypothetical protein U9R50_04770 [Campylobacterota bacterium]|nr:hypothetical protein [Campylobacterota bacterium]
MKTFILLLIGLNLIGMTFFAAYTFNNESIKSLKIILTLESMATLFCLSLSYYALCKIREHIKMMTVQSVICDMPDAQIKLNENPISTKEDFDNSINIVNELASYDALTDKYHIANHFLFPVLLTLSFFEKSAKMLSIEIIILLSISMFIALLTVRKKKELGYGD